MMVIKGLVMRLFYRISGAPQTNPIDSLKAEKFFLAVMGGKREYRIVRKM